MVQPTSFHVKVKREKLTIFVECQGAETVAQLKGKVAGMTGRSPKEIRLIWKDQALDDSTTLSNAGIGLDSIITMAYWISNDKDAQKSAWEPTPAIVPYPNPEIHGNQNNAA